MEQARQCSRPYTGKKHQARKHEMQDVQMESSPSSRALPAVSAGATGQATASSFNSCVNV
jgi:hypothetical protein